MKHLNFNFVKIHPKAIVPEKVSGNLGFDLSVVRDESFFKHSAPSKLIVEPKKYRHVLQAGVRKVFHTGLKISAQDGYGTILKDRSGMAAKHGIHVLAGVIDSSYIGEIMVCLLNTSNVSYEILEGDRIAQCIIVPEYSVTFSEQIELDNTLRGEKGFGSSGR